MPAAKKATATADDGPATALRLTRRTQIPAPTLETPGEALNYARYLSGLEQQEVAVKLGVNTKTISRWEGDFSSPRLDQWVELAKVLHAPWLLDAAIEAVRGTVPLYGADLRVAPGPQKLPLQSPTSRSRAALSTVR